MNLMYLQEEDITVSDLSNNRTCLGRGDMVLFVTFKGLDEVRIANPISKLRKWRLLEEVICLELNGTSRISIHISLSQTPKHCVDWLPEGKGGD